jgi:hypothetical protein
MNREVCRVDTDQVQIEERMQISSKKEAIVWFM